MVKCEEKKAVEAESLSQATRRIRNQRGTSGKAPAMSGQLACIKKQLPLHHIKSVLQIFATTNGNKTTALTTTTSSNHATEHCGAVACISKGAAATAATFVVPQQ
ncbi:unnamed protein product [Ceratitis capitata]|uniref:(Mediterranean fruit fly) hypothetical protein n=1 Tax=Ceratitis capitata TaxID=7213 RepID=A0A811V3P9_CERCA|nr:unnamed protein product [Ceratitis capitata]